MITDPGRSVLMKKKGLSLLLTAVMLVTGVFAGGSLVMDKAAAKTAAATTDAAAPANTSAAGKTSIVKTNKELRGLWLAFCDFKSVGLYKKSKSAFKRNSDRIMKAAKKNKCNAIFLHVRAFDDAIWKSKTFDASVFLVGSKRGAKRANVAYTYDPMKILCTSAKKYGLEVHAWMNPYRITYTKFFNPKYKSSRNRVLTAVKEVSKYDIQGIHFDDYFYHSAGGYLKHVYNTAKAATKSSKTKRTYVNRLVKQVYKLSHKKGLVFGISPQGNYENDMNDGADVKKWLSKTGYVDYVAPQIYWTDNWGSSGSVKMFTSRLNQFTRLNKKPSKIKLYIGLALYRCGFSQSDDKGWGRSNANMKKQVKKIRKSKYVKKGVRGFILFEAENLYQKRCKKELANLRKILK